jgi:NTE family protein
MNEWQRELINWRCKLSPAERSRLGASAAWDCRDVKIFVGRVAFDQLGPQRAAALNAVETAFKLPPDQVDTLIAAGHDALRGSTVFNSFLNSIGPARPRSRPIASPAFGAHEALAQ